MCSRRYGRLFNVVRLPLLWLAPLGAFRIAGDIELMSETDQLNVGARLRSLRRQRGLSMQLLAERSSLSVNAIGRVERGESSPTVSSLHRCARALGVSVTAFFETQPERSIVLVRRNGRPRSQGDGVLVESLGAGLEGQSLGPFLMTVLPGAGGERPIAHGGEEFAHCVEGEVEYLVNDVWYRLEAGDSLLFQASQPHAFRNTSLEKAVVLLVVQASDEDIGFTQQQHLMRASGVRRAPPDDPPPAQDRAGLAGALASDGE
jgi:transcriptional regulator with XRE-family HTH domain